jgi:hypothetical protein
MSEQQIPQYGEEWRPPPEIPPDTPTTCPKCGVGVKACPLCDGVGTIPWHRYLALVAEDQRTEQDNEIPF